MDDNNKKFEDLQRQIMAGSALSQKLIDAEHKIFMQEEIIKDLNSKIEAQNIIINAYFFKQNMFLIAIVIFGLLMLWRPDLMHKLFCNG